MPAPDNKTEAEVFGAAYGWRRDSQLRVVRPAEIVEHVGSAKSDVVPCQEFHNGDFNWFDLIYQGR